MTLKYFFLAVCFLFLQGNCTYAHDLCPLLLKLLMLRDTLYWGQTVPAYYLQTVTLAAYTQTRVMERRATDNKWWRIQELSERGRVRVQTNWCYCEEGGKDWMGREEDKKQTDRFRIESRTRVVKKPCREREKGKDLLGGEGGQETKHTAHWNAEDMLAAAAPIKSPLLALTSTALLACLTHPPSHI